MAGTVNGLLGTGGGIILIFMLSSLDAGEKRDIFATTVLCILLLSIVTAFIYSRKGLIDFAFSFSLLVPALAGGAVGALLLDKINLNFLRKIFAAMVIYCGFSMVFN